MHSEDEKNYTADGNIHDVANQGHESEDKQKKKKKQKKGEKPKVVSPFALFRYSTWSDKLLMILGTILAVAHGSSLPISMIIFGDMTDSFVASGDLNFTGKNISAVLRTMACI
ncbi:PREDICTED: multidrug resistance protein 1A-like [Lepidothrix coronata]|uniref:Multidrug resistance protein 1A-like n=1 Tax=Lepidothrix coronata TaxID=321398 RepID=A0A6J0J732_9PASS|nr:PREDICTED: multidrug resistance protein 1A-like [Lepidothrix coronata]XP_017694755.1 PREDICTED: multidrug resistance protein 1A-like [Lepidothrix coronata]